MTILAIIVLIILVGAVTWLAGLRRELQKTRAANHELATQLALLRPPIDLEDTPAWRDSLKYSTRQRDREWSLTDEREYLENILQTRLNFFLVFYGLVLSAVSQTEDRVFAAAVSFFGALVSLLFAITLARSHRKSDDAIKILKAWTGHPVWLGEQLAGSRSVRRILSIYIPHLCWISLVISCAYFFAIRGGDGDCDKRSVQSTVAYYYANQSTADRPEKALSALVILRGKILGKSLVGKSL